MICQLDFTIYTVMGQRYEDPYVFYLVHNISHAHGLIMSCAWIDMSWERFKISSTRVNISYIRVKGILSTSWVIFSYPKLLSISVLTFIKWRLNTELLTNTLRNVVFSTKKADHRYRKLINYALIWARPTLFIYLFLCQ